MAAEPTVTALLHTHATRRQKKILDCCAVVAQRSKTPIYLVGGAVRDLLMVGDFLDIDVTVEGNAAEIARGVADELEGELRVHDRFLTAEVSLEESHVDIVTARKERYEGPAMLPEVSPGTLKEDLERRDFAINAMAIRLWPEGADLLIDPFDGRRDLERRRLRILHNLSFLDDPTRILRGVRLGSRLDLQLGARTEDLAKAAIEGHAFDPLSSSRLCHELILLLEDRAVASSLRLLDQWGFMDVLGRVEPVAQSDWHLLEALILLRQQLERSQTESIPVRWWLTYLMGLFWSTPRRTRGRLSDRLGLDPEMSILMTTFPERLQTTQDRLADSTILPHEVCSVLESHQPEEIVLLQATSTSSARRWVERWLAELRDIRLQIGGAELREAGFKEGPAYGRALESTLNALRDGLIQPDEELEFALDHLRAQKR